MKSRTQQPNEASNDEPTPNALKPTPDVLKTVYAEICGRDEHIWDLRLRLLAALPVVSGTAIGILITVEEDTRPLYLIPFGVFGAVVTAGLFLYERRQMNVCRQLLSAGAAIEKQLGIEAGRFRGRPPDNFVSVSTAGWFVYGASCLAWVFLSVVGIVQAVR